MPFLSSPDASPPKGGKALFVGLSKSSYTPPQAGAFDVGNQGFFSCPPSDGRHAQAGFDTQAQVLPSAQSALAFVQGERGAWIGVARDVLLRSSLVGIGLYLAGERETTPLIKKSLAAAGVIEAVVLLLAYNKAHATK